MTEPGWVWGQLHHCSGWSLKSSITSFIIIIIIIIYYYLLLFIYFLNMVVIQLYFLFWGEEPWCPWLELGARWWSKVLLLLFVGVKMCDSWGQTMFPSGSQY